MAIKFHMPGGAEVDMVILAVKFFPVASGEEFRDLLVAISESPADAPKPTKLDQFAASHPTFPAACATSATPDSFADGEYRGIDAFAFVDKAGHRQAVRYIMAPEKLVHLTADKAARKPPNFLVDDLPQRIAKRPVVFHLKAQLAAAGGHRGVFDPAARDSQLGVTPLTRLLSSTLSVPMIAAGSVMDGAGIAAMLDLGAHAAQLETAFIGCPESSADQNYRDALLGPAAAATEMTALLSGRHARCLPNAFTALRSGPLQGLEPPDYLYNRHFL